ncbi:AAA family ATPase [Acinetobacter sp. 187]|uniref:AAA family ATPase n=1 Tax=Acinetobacter lanii TaxID=2715163 RepID=UPI00140E3E44|nr:AAA family ATPase [Acinetobacter lanii]NHC03728.1 AAA family ATPase [Acinetobacter lanii]
MKLQSIHLRHAHHFADLNIKFNATQKPISLILGQQSSGKTAILKNIYQALTWFPARFKDNRTAGVVMLDSDIMQHRVQSKIEVQVRFPSEIGSLAESTTSEEKDVSVCAWKLYKTLNSNGVGFSKVDTQQLEQMAKLYNQALAQDPFIGLPMIAYYPTDRFVNEMNLISKNNPGVFQQHSAYELAALPYTTFARFFEWFREVSDIENAQTAQLFQQILQQSKQQDAAPTDANTSHNTQQDPSADDASETTFKDSSLSQSLFQAQAQLHTPSLNALKTALNTVFPELSDLYLEYQPKLQLMVVYQAQTMPFSQLSNSIRNWVALVGDIVRRMCLLNPKSLFPCMEGDGILLIDNIDAQLDQDMTQNVLPRLHQAFPNVQIIATGTSEDLLEHATHYQYFRLEHQSLEEIDLEANQMALDDLYQDLMSEVSASELEQLTEPQTTLNKVETLFEQVQQLSDEQQQALLKLMRGDDSHQSVKL